MDNGDTDFTERLKAAVNDGQQQAAAAEAKRLQKEEAAREAARQLEERTKEVQARVAENVAKTTEGLKLVQRTLDGSHKFGNCILYKPNC
jgi:hypothetical protein